MPTRISLPYAPRRHQQQFHAAAKRFSVVVCHRRFGKTVMAVNQLLRCVLTTNQKRPQGAYLAPTYGQAKRIAWAYCREFAGAIPGTRFIESELRIDLPGGQRIWLMGAESPDRLRGLYLDYVVMDEYADISARLFPEVIRPALAERNGGALWLGTPRGYNQFWDIYAAAQKAQATGDSEWFACLYRASDTNILPKSELEAAARDMSDEQYQQEFECSFNAAVSGAYYAKLLDAAERDKRIGKVGWEPLQPVHTAWDLGFSDATAIWFFQERPEGRNYIDFYEASGEGLLHYAKYLSEKPYVYGEHIQPHDVRVRELGSGKSRFEMLNELGIRCRIAPMLSVQDGIEASRILLRNCSFDATKCHGGLDALRQYRRSYDPVSRNLRDKPLHDWTSHAADAFRISAVGGVGTSRRDMTRIAHTGRMETGEPAVIGYDAEID